MALPGSAWSGPTLEEVAREAGMSRSTVSRVVNDSPGVSTRARDAVSAAIERLGYVPNEAARSLVTRRTNSIALVVSEPGDRVFGDPFFAQMLRGIHAGLFGRKRQLTMMMLAEGSGGGDSEQLATYLSSGHVDGALVVSMHGDDPLPGRLADAGLPIVIGGRPLSGGPVPYVDSDNLTGGTLAAGHLAATGRRRIGTIAGPADMAVGIDRLHGWRNGMASAGMPADAVVHSDFTVDGGAAAMARLLDLHPDLDAVFAAADIVAVGAMRELAARRKRVPEDVAVVGFDDSVLATTTTPQLTTIRQDVEELGRTAITRLLDELDGRGQLSRSILLPTELVVRASA